MYGLRGHTTGSHGKNDGGGTAHGIAACKYPWAASQAVGISLQSTPRLGVQSGSGALDEWVGVGAKGDDYIVYFHLEVATFKGAEFATSFFVKVAHGHSYAPHGTDVSLFVAEEFGGVGKE